MLFLYIGKNSLKNIQKEYKNMFFDIPDVVDLEIADVRLNTVSTI